MLTFLCSVRCCAIVLMTLPLLPAAAQQPYQVLHHWKIGGTGGWDYLLADPAAHLLYVTHGPQVEVVDSNSGKVVARSPA